MRHFLSSCTTIILVTLVPFSAIRAQVPTFSPPATAPSPGTTPAESPSPTPQPLPAADLERLFKELTAIKEQRDEQRKILTQQGVTYLLQATQSEKAAREAYMTAIEINDFKGRPDGNSGFSDWKDANSALLGHPAVEAALMLHLQYLALSLQRAGKPESPPDYDSIVGYLKNLITKSQEIADSYRARGGRDPDDKAAKKLDDEAKKLVTKLLNDSIDKSSMVRAYQIDGVISRLTQWEKVPSNWSGILANNIRPFLREEQNPRLLATWDLQIDIAKAAVGEDPTELEITRVSDVDIPRALWGKAEDMLLLGDTAGAYGEMFGLIKRYPAHPDAPEWLNRMLGMVAPPDVEIASSTPFNPTPTPTPEPAN